jgi:CxxC motif-containing protein (DUF1111 family)
MITRALLILSCILISCGDSTLPTGTTVSDLSGSQEAMFRRGSEQFNRVFTVEEGLGPIFNEQSCSGCHPQNGRGPSGTYLVRFSRAGDPILNEGGPQLQSSFIPGVSPEALPPGVETSIRLGPQILGVGLIEAIPVSTIEALADPDDLDGNGISGRVNYVNLPEFVTNVERGSTGQAIGRFGWKAAVPSLVQQVVTAFHQDMGITTVFIPEESRIPRWQTLRLWTRRRIPK